MAIVTATITVDFTAFYSGNHRVCWRVQGSGDPYDCTTIVNCPGGGTACQAIFNADVNTTSCDGTVVFEGYVQAACEDILSTNGRLDFTVNFVPNPTCLRHELSCDSGPIGAITINDPGFGYLVADTVVITRDGGDTETADAIISINAVGDGVINSLSGLLSGGSNYAPTDTIDITDVSGSGTNGLITVDSVDGGGGILTFTLTNGGTDYIGPFTFNVTSGIGVGADFDIQPGVDYDPDGSILSFTITDGGSYGIIPTVSITTGTGSDFDGAVQLDNCPTIDNLGTDCVGGDLIQLIGGIPVGDTFATCLATGPFNVAPPYSIVQTGCCIPEDTELGDPCADYHFENNSGGNVDVHATDCYGDDVTFTVNDGVTVSRCLVVDGVIDPEVSGFIITNTGTPCT